MSNFSRFSDYLRYEKNCATHTITAYLADLTSFRAFLQEGCRGRLVDEANYPEIRNWIVFLVEGGLSNRTINRKISSLKAYYVFLLKVGQLKKNPLAKHRALRTAKRIQIPFSKEEVSATLAGFSAISDFEGVRDQLILELFYATGIRRIELVGLRMADLDFGNQRIKVLGKRNKQRYIPLLPSIMKTLDRYLSVREAVVSDVSEEALFLTKKGVKIYETLVYRVINKYFSNTSLKEKKSPHILRHSFATHLLNEGADLNAVKELLGHASLAATEIYTQYDMLQLGKVHRSAHPRNKKR